MVWAFASFVCTSSDTVIGTHSILHVAAAETRFTSCTWPFRDESDEYEKDVKVYTVYGNKIGMHLIIRAIRNRIYNQDHLVVKIFHTKRKIHRDQFVYK